MLAKVARLSVIAIKITSVLTELNFMNCTSERNESAYANKPGIGERGYM